MSIKISTPRVIRGGGTSRLEADISFQHEGKDVEEILFYEVNIKWGKFFVDELSDAFVLPLLEMAFEKGENIEFKAPMTEDLKYQLETYLIPIFVRKCPELKPFRLIGNTVSSRIESEGVAGTGFSAGVDSFYSVLKHLDNPYDSKRVTHLLLAVNGAAQTGIRKEMDQKWFDEELKRFTPLAEEMRVQLIGVNSNVSLLNCFRKNFKGGSGITTSGFVHALRKLFGTYYWASAYEADILEFRTDDLGYVEPFFLPLLSVDGLRFYHSGAEVSRIEKVEFIADYAVVQKGLTVCGNTKNCGRCNKCSRTMAELYAIGKLEKFKEVFPDIDIYEKNLNRNLGMELAQDHPPFTTEILDYMNHHGKKVSFSAFFWEWFWFKPFNFAKQKLKYNKFLMHLYYEKGIAQKLGQPIQSTEYIKARLAGEKFEK